MERGQRLAPGLLHPPPYRAGADHGPTGEPTDDPDTSTDDDPTATPLQDIVRLAATKVDVLLQDTQRDRLAGPGDTVRYLVILTNTGTAAATGVRFLDRPDPNSSLIPGSVVTTQGTVTTGNTAGDTAVAVAVGTLSGTTRAMVQFDVVVDNPLATEIVQLRNQGVVTAMNHPPVRTDDPATTIPGDPTDTPLAGTPDLRLVKTDGDVVRTPGSTLAYTLGFTNVGTQDATGVELTETVPAHTTFAAAASTAGWTCRPNRQAGSTCRLAIGAVAGGSSGSATFAVTIAHPLPTGVLLLTNSAHIADDGRNGPDPTLTDNTATDTTPVAAAPDLRLTKDGGVTVTPGTTLPYTLHFTNAGTQDATGVVLTEIVPAHTTFVPDSSTAGWRCIPDGGAGHTCTLGLGTLAVGRSGSARFAVTVAPALPAEVTQIVNMVTIADDGRNGLDRTPENNTATTTTPVAVRPTLTLTKTDALTTDADGSGNVTPGDTLTYTVKVTNPGTIDIRDVVFIDTPDPNTTLVVGSVTTTQGTVDTGNAAGDTNVAVTIGDLPSEQTVTVVFAVVVNDLLSGVVTEIVNQGMVVSAEVPGVVSDDPETRQVSDPTRTPLGLEPVLEALKTAVPLTDADTSGGVTPGDTLRYTITLRNVGTAAATAVRFTDPPSPGLTLVPGSVTSTAGTITSGNAAGDTTVEVEIGTLAPGATVTIVLDAQIAEPLPAGVTVLRNQGLATSDDTPEEPTDDPDTPPDDDPTETPLQDTVKLSAVKTDLLVRDRDGDGQASPGETLRYVVTLRNTGTAAATNVRFTDTPDANSPLVVGSVATSVGTVITGNTDGDTDVVIDLGTLGSGATVTVLFAVRINATLPAGVNQLANQGRVTAVEVPDGVDTDDPDTVDTPDPTVTPLTGAPDLQVTKDDHEAVATPGGLLTYTLRLANVGTQEATGVTLTETVPEHTTFNADASDEAWQCRPDQTCALTVGTLAADRSTAVTFAVTVDTPLPASVTQITNTVRIADDGANGDDPTPEDNEAAVTTPTVPGNVPDLQVTKDDHGAVATPGALLVYSLRWANVGLHDATGVLLTETVPANTTFVAAASPADWQCRPDGRAGNTCELPVGAVAAGESAAVTFAVLVSTQLPANVTQIANTVHIADDGSQGDDPAPADNTASLITPVQTPSAGVLMVTKADAVTDADASGTASPGETLTYTIVVRNPGTVAVSQVVVTDTPDTHTTLVVGSVAPSQGTVQTGNEVGDTTVAVRLGTLQGGTTATVTFDVVLREALPADVTHISNQSLAVGQGVAGVLSDDPDTPQVQDPTRTPVGRQPRLEALKLDVLDVDADASGGVTPGDTLRYVIALRNAGAVPATEVVFTDIPGAGTTLLVGSVSSTVGTVTQGNTAGNTSIAVALGTMAPGAIARVSFAVRVDDPRPSSVTLLRNQGLVTAVENPTGEPTDDPSTPAANDPTVTPLQGVVALRAIKTDVLLTDRDGDRHAGPGDTLRYVITLANTGTAAATSVQFTDTPDTNSALVVGSVATSQGTVTMGNASGDTTVAVTFGTLSAGTKLPAEVTTVVNTARIADDGRSGPDTTPEDNGAHTTTPVTVTPALLVTKLDALTTDADASGDVTPGDTLTYAIEVRNVGDVAVRDVVFIDAPDPNTTLVAGSVTPSQGTIEAGNTAGDTTVTVALGAVPGGETVFLTFAVVINTPLPGTVTHVANQGLVTTAELPGVLSDDPETPEVSDPTRTPLHNTPRLEAIKDTILEHDADASGAVTPGDTLLYLVTLRNVGMAAATDVVFTDTPGMGTTLLAGSVTTTVGTITQGNTTGDTAVEVTVGTVEAEASVTISFMVQVNPRLPVEVTALQNQGLISAHNSVDEPTDDPRTPADNDATITPLQETVRLAAGKTSLLLVDGNGDGQAGPGDTVRYIVALGNTGTATATDVQFTDTPDANSTLVVGSVITSTGAVTSGNTAGNTTVVVELGSLEGGAQSTVRFDVMVNGPLPSGIEQLRNQGRLVATGQPNVPTDDPTTAAVQDPTVTPLRATPDLQLTKETSGTTMAIPGEVLLYTLRVTNAGRQDASGVRFMETVPTHTTFDAEASSDDWVCTPDIRAGSRCTLAPGALAAGASATAIFAVTVSPTLPAAATEIANTARVTDNGRNGPDPTPENNTARATTPLTATPQLAVTKTDAPTTDAEAPGTVSAGDALTYTVAVTNPGALEVVDALFTDAPDANTTLMVGSVTTTRGTIRTGNTAGDSTVAVAIGSLPGGESVLVTFTVVVNTPLPSTVTQVANQGLVTGADVPGVLSDDPETLQVADPTVTPLGSRPLLDAVKRDALQRDADASDGITAGDTLRYTVTLTNAGTAAATEVVFTDTPGANTALVAGSVRSAGTIIQGNAPGDTTVTVDVGTVAPGALVTITFDVQLRAAIPPRVVAVTNQGLVTSADDSTGEPTDDPDTPADDDRTATHLQGRPRLEAVKSAVLHSDADSDGLAGPGDTVQYVITVANVGTAPATAVRFTDTPDANTVLVVGSVAAPQGTVTLGNVPGDGDIAVTFATLGGGESVTLSFRVTINDPLPPDVERIVNQGTVSTAETALIRTDDPTTPAADDPTETPLVGAGSIGDLVWNDLDGDGMRAAEEPGLAGITVVLTEAGRDGHLGTADDVPFPAQTTDANGVYTFTALRRGTYRVEVDATTLPAGSVLTTDNAPLRVTLDAGAMVQDADFGYQQQGQVSGHVFNDRNGDGVQQPDEPDLAGVTVRITESQGGTQAVTTDAEGNYIATVPVGETTLAVDETTVPEGLVLTTNNAQQTVTVTGGMAIASSPVGYQQANMPPVAINDTATTQVNTAVTIPVLDNDRDPDNDTLTIVSTTPPTNGTVTINPDGTITYTPNAGFLGPDTFTYTIRDVAGNLATATVTINFTNVFDPPSGRKTVNADSLPVLAWRMVWLNSGNVVATAVRIVDPIPAGTTFVAGSLTCEARGASTVRRCAFDAAADRVLYEGTIAPDPGAIDEADAAHEVVITFHTTLSPEAMRIENQGMANWDEDGDGTVEDDIAAGQVPARSDDPDTPAPGDPTVVLMPPRADLAIQKTGPARIAPGDTLTYTITVRNAGPDAAVEIVVTDPTSEGLTFRRAETPCRAGFPCTIARLEAGAELTFTVSFRVPTDYAGPDPIRNTAAVASSVTDPDPSNNSITSATAAARPAQADLVLTKTGPPSAARGSTVTYTLMVSNNGSDDATTVVLDDPTPRRLTFVEATTPCAAGFPCALGMLNAEASMTIQVTFAVPSAYAGPDPIVNTATVASTTADPNPSNNMASIATPVGNDTIDLALTKTGPTQVTLGADVTYTLVVTNNGPGTATGVSLEESVPAELVLVSASAPCQAGFPCALGTLNARASITVTVTFHVPTTYTGPNPIVNMALVTANEPERAGRNNSANAATGIAAAAADLLITKRGPAVVTAGEVATYTLVVTNTGPGTATNLSLDDPTPPALERLAISAPCDDGFPCVLGDLAAGSALALTVTFRVPEDYIGPNPLTNTATVTSDAPDPDPANNTDTAQTFVSGVTTGACLFQYRSPLVPGGAPGDGDQGGQDPEGSDDPVDGGGTSQATPAGRVLTVTTPREADVVVGTAVAVAVLQAPVTTRTVSALRTVTVANGAAPALVDIVEQPGTKTERLPVSPSLAATIRDRAALRAIVRFGLTPVVWSVWVVMHGTGTHALLLLGFTLLVGVGVSWCVYRRGR